MKRDRKDVLILVLVLIVVILIVVVGYVFLVSPALNGLVIKGYNQGQVDTINAILLQVSNSGYVELYTANNQSLILIPYQAEAQ